MRYTIAIVLVSAAACTNDFECYSDRACGEGSVCNGGVCIVGERGRAGDASGGDSPGADVYEPIVTITSPRPFELVSGVITFRATIVDQVAVGEQGRREVDPAGVDPSAVVAVVMGRFSAPMSRSVDGSGEYRVDFDTRQLGDAGLPSLVITADDLLGNRGEAGIEFALDNAAPVAGLESGPMQFYRISPSGPQEGAIECSRVINPHGETAVQHGDVIDPDSRFGLSFFVRARIEDRGNGAFPNLPVPIAGIETTSTRVYMLGSQGGNPPQPLLVTDPDTAGCRINPNAIPDPEDPAPPPDKAIVQNLVPGGPDGQPSFAKLAPPDVIPVNDPCDFGGWEPPEDGEDDEEPAPLVCGSIDPTATIWVHYTTDGAPAIWMLNDYNPQSVDSALCAGGGFDTGNFLEDGPVCLAVSAEDTLGNRTVSPPIAICIESDRALLPGGAPNPSYGDCAGFNRSAINAVAMCSDGCAGGSSPPLGFGDPTDPNPTLRFWANVDTGGGTDRNGACCIAGGSCFPSDGSDCAANNGTFQGEGTSCSVITCP